MNTEEASLPTRVLRPSRLKTIGLFLVCVIFAAIGLLMIRGGESMGYVPANLFGIGVVVFGLQLVPGGSYLKLASDGFTVCSLFRAHSTPWTAMDYFEAGLLGWRRPGHKGAVVFNYREEYEEHELARKVSSRLGGHEGALPDTYGMEPRELADLMNSYRKHYTRDFELKNIPYEDGSYEKPDPHE